MSGHSKWAQIKRKKAITDAKKGKAFTRFARAITVTAKEGGGDPSGNIRLRLAIETARKANMPYENVERAIRKGTGEGSEQAVVSVTYEAFGPAHATFLIEAVTDNRNRTLGQIRELLGNHGGRLGEAGTVAWMFMRKGYVVFDAAARTDALELVLIEAGAEDVEEQEGQMHVSCPPEALSAVQKVLADASLPLYEAEVHTEAKDPVVVSVEDRARVETLAELLEELDDVVSVTTNIADAVEDSQ